MNHSEFAELKDGSKVVFLGSKFAESVTDDSENLPPIGTVLTRDSSWLDDSECVQFNYEVDGLKDSHFFYAEEIDLIKE